MNKETDELGLGAASRGKIGRLPRKVRVDLSKMMEEGYGTRDLLAIAEIIGVDMLELVEIADRLRAEGLFEEVSSQ